MKNKIFILFSALIMSLSWHHTIESKKPKRPYSYPVYSDTPVANAAGAGEWFARPDGWTSLHEALQACHSWGWGSVNTKPQVDKIIADAKKQKVNINSLHTPTNRKPLDVAKQYCPNLVPYLKDTYQLEETGAAPIR